MIKPASSGDLRITTTFFPPYTQTHSLSQCKEGIITRGTNHHVQQLNHNHLEDITAATNRRGENTCKHVYSNVTDPPVMTFENRSKIKGNLEKMPLIFLLLDSALTQFSPTTVTRLCITTWIQLSKQASSIIR